MKKICIVIIFVCSMLSGCRDMYEPNDIAYVVAMGIDKAEEKNYNITIQFAKPVQISGGSEGSGSGGKDMVENIVVEAPTMFAALNVANQLVSKKFDLSHAKLVVFSEDVARSGVNNFMESISRNSDIRPNIYFAVALGSAQEYLESVKPMLEISPVKYYQLIYEKFSSVYAPNNPALDFFFSENSLSSDSVLPLAGVLPDKKEEDQGSGSSGGSESSGGSGGDQGSGGSGSSGGESKPESFGSDEKPEKNMDSFNFYMPNYMPGEVPKQTQNKSESIGMALFSKGKMVGTMGAIDSELYNMVMGRYESSYVPYKNNKNDDIITLRIEQDKKPHIKVDVSDDSPKIDVKLALEGEIMSVPNYYVEEENILVIEEIVKQETKKAVNEFLYKTSQEHNKDICKFGDYAKRSFLTNNDFMEYKWREKYHNSDFNVDVSFKIRRSGLILKNSVEAK